MKISSNLATSIDGKIATTNREPFPLGTPYDRKLMAEIRSKHDAVLFGGTTLRTWQRYCFAAPLPKGADQPWNIVISHQLKGIDPNWPFFKTRAGRRLLVVTGSISLARRKQFERHCEILSFADFGNSSSAMRRFLAELARRGIRSIVVEGGGEIMWSFVRFNLIEEYFLTLTPRILGGVGAPSLVQGEGLSPKDSLKLRLLECRKIGDELYLRYGRRSRRLTT